MLIIFTYFKDMNSFSMDYIETLRNGSGNKIYKKNVQQSYSFGYPSPPFTFSHYL